MSRGRPLFVVIEGVDRCGKNLQAEMLVKRFVESGEVAELFTTPDYDLDTGKLASRMLLGQVGIAGEGREAADEALTLECVLEANRYEVAAKIARTLRAGSHAVCVRWWPSSLLYAGEDGLSPERCGDACAQLPAPDAYILLDVVPEVLKSRRDTRNRYEGDDRKQERLAEAYRVLWNHNRSDLPRGNRWFSVPAGHPPDHVSVRLWDLLQVARGRLT